MCKRQTYFSTLLFLHTEQSSWTVRVFHFSISADSIAYYYYWSIQKGEAKNELARLRLRRAGRDGQGSCGGQEKWTIKDETTEAG
jgi:hypothetical protein